MSQENVEVLRHAYNAFNGRDWDRALAVFAPDAEWHEPDLPEAAVYRGPASIRGYWEGLAQILPAFRSEPQRFYDADDQIVVASLVSGAGSGSGAAVAGEVGMVWTFRGDRVVRCVVHRRLEDALEAAGLTEYPSC